MIKKLLNFPAALYSAIMQRLEPGESFTGFIRKAAEHEIAQRDEHEAGFDRDDLERRISEIEARMADDGK